MFRHFLNLDSRDKSELRLVRRHHVYKRDQRFVERRVGASDVEEDGDAGIVCVGGGGGVNMCWDLAL